jgi:hypothetical protein
MANGSLTRVEPSGTWSQGAELRRERRGASSVTSASLSGRQQRVWIIRAFSPGYNMTGLRPCRSGVDSVVGKVALSGQRWVKLGKGGQEVGKPTGFSHFETALTHLFPDKSTQVVDFPRMYEVRVFWSGVKFSFQSQAGLGTKAGTFRKKLCEKLRIVTRKFAKFHESPRKFAQIRPVNPRCYALLRVRPIFLGEEVGNQGERRRFCMVLFGFWADAIKIGSAI